MEVSSASMSHTAVSLKHCRFELQEEGLISSRFNWEFEVETIHFE